MVKTPEYEYAEEWRQIEGYEGLYTISNLGRVRSEPRIDPNSHHIGGHLLRQALLPNGYLRVILCRNSKVRTCLVHRLVAQAFLGPRPSGMLVHHINENKLDNTIGNLEYLTPKKHAQHHFTKNPWPTSKRERNYNNAKLTAADVIEVRRLRVEGMTHRAIAKVFGVSRQCITAIMSTKTKQPETQNENPSR